MLAAEKYIFFKNLCNPGSMNITGISSTQLLNSSWSFLGFFLLSDRSHYLWRLKNGMTRCTNWKNNILCLDCWKYQICSSAAQQKYQTIWTVNIDKTLKAWGNNKPFYIKIKISINKQKMKLSFYLVRLTEISLV